MRALLLLGLVLSAQAKADAVVGSDLLVCAQSTGAVKGQCRLETLPLTNKQAYEKEFVVEYEYPCFGPATDFYLRSGDNADLASTTETKIQTLKATAGSYVQ